MEIVYNIIVPLITSIIGGLLGGLFTFLGVKLTIKNEKELKQKDIQEHNKEKNETIIQNRPEFKVVEIAADVKTHLEVYALPYINPKLQTEDKIIFDYDNLNLSDDFWDCKETLICNCGKTAIEAGFMQVAYKSKINIYSKYELDSWRDSPWARNYYSDKYSFSTWISPNECINLKLFYPKNKQYLQDMVLNCYFSDEFGNKWYQDIINRKANGNKSTPISPNEYILHIQDDYYKWFVYDTMYYNKDIEKCFNAMNFQKTLQERKEKLWKQQNENEKYKVAVTTGEELLKS